MVAVNAKHIIPIALVVTGWLLGSVPAIAQSAWPTAKKTAVVQQPSRDQRRKPAKPDAAAVATRRAKRGSSRIPAMTADRVMLRAMSEIIARQTLAIEALAVRLEAAERRLDLGASAPVRLKPDTTSDTTSDTAEALVDDPFDPFRAARAVDWAQVLEGRVP